MSNRAVQYLLGFGNVRYIFCPVFQLLLPKLFRIQKIPETKSSVIIMCRNNERVIKGLVKKFVYLLIHFT